MGRRMEWLEIFNVFIMTEELEEQQEEYIVA